MQRLIGFAFASWSTSGLRRSLIDGLIEGLIGGFSRCGLIGWRLVRGDVRLSKLWRRRRIGTILIQERHGDALGLLPKVRGAVVLRLVLRRPAAASTRGRGRGRRRARLCFALHQREHRLEDALRELTGERRLRGLVRLQATHLYARRAVAHRWCATGRSTRRRRVRLGTHRTRSRAHSRWATLPPLPRKGMLDFDGTRAGGLTAWVGLLLRETFTENEETWACCGVPLRVGRESVVQSYASYPAAPYACFEERMDIDSRCKQNSEHKVSLKC